MKLLNEKLLTKLFIILCAIIALILAIIQPDNSAPDEEMKMDVCKFIAEYGELPYGGDERIRNELWGISYAFTPILSYIFGGFFIKIASLFTNDIHIFYISARLFSVLCYVISVFFVIKISKKLFKDKYIQWLFTIFISLLPQFIYLGSYINNDSLALMSISMIIYFWLCGIENKWKTKDSIGLAFSLGICALSYYNAYGYILTSAIIFIVYGIINKLKISEIIKKGILIVIITFLICGWWFIRSALKYEGDFLGLKTTDEYANKYAREDLKPNNRDNPFNNHISIFTMLLYSHWIKSTIASFISVFGGMNIRTSGIIYFIVCIIIFIGILGYLLEYLNKKYFQKLKKDKNLFLLEVIFLFNIIIPIILSLYYSYYSDFQPQGRYIMPILIPLMYFVTLGYENIFDNFIKNKKINKLFKILLIISIVFISIICLRTIFKVYVFKKGIIQ